MTKNRESDHSDGYYARSEHERIRPLHRHLDATYYREDGGNRRPDNRYTSQIDSKHQNLLRSTLKTTYAFFKSLDSLVNLSHTLIETYTESG